MRSRGMIRFWGVILGVIFSSFGFGAQLSFANDEPADVKHVVPIYGNIVTIYTPANWPFEAAHEQNSRDSYIIEFIPDGQSVDDWQEMITIVGRKDFEGTPKQFFTGMYLAYQGVCTEENTAGQVLLETAAVLVGTLYCGGLAPQTSNFAGLKPGQGEMAIYRIEKRDGHLYTVFKSWRDDAYDVKSDDAADFPGSQSEVSEYVKVLLSTRIVAATSR